MLEIKLVRDSGGAALRGGRFPERPKPFLPRGRSYGSLGGHPGDLRGAIVKIQVRGQSNWMIML